MGYFHFWIISSKLESHLDNEDNEEPTLFCIYVLEDGTCTLKVTFHSLSHHSKRSTSQPSQQRRRNILWLDAQEIMADSITVQNICILISLISLSRVLSNLKQVGLLLVAHRAKMWSCFKTTLPSESETGKIGTHKGFDSTSEGLNRDSN